MQFPLNALASCPKSRCNLFTGASNQTVNSLLTGLPLFDLFSKMGVTMGMGANQLLTFDITKLNKVGEWVTAGLGSARRPVRLACQPSCVRAACHMAAPQQAFSPAPVCLRVRLPTRLRRPSRPTPSCKSS